MGGAAAMINGVFIINNQGKPRLAKFYEYLVRARRGLRLRARKLTPAAQDDETQQRYIRETFKVISKRDDKLCNFVEGGPWGDGTRIVYRCVRPPSSPAAASRTPPPRQPPARG